MSRHRAITCGAPYLIRLALFRLGYTSRQITTENRQEKSDNRSTKLKTQISLLHHSTPTPKTSVDACYYGRTTSSKQLEIENHEPQKQKRVRHGCTWWCLAWAKPDRKNKFESWEPIVEFTMDRTMNKQRAKDTNQDAQLELPHSFLQGPDIWYAQPIKGRNCCQIMS